MGVFYSSIKETIAEYKILLVYLTKVKVKWTKRERLNPSRDAERFLLWQGNVRKKKRFSDYLCGVSYLDSTLNA